MVTKSSIDPPEKSKFPDKKVPTLIRKALERSGIHENEIPDFLDWAFDGEIPDTFWKLCIIWNKKFGSQLWLNVTELGTAPEFDLFFFKMGEVFVKNKAETIRREKDKQSEISLI